MYSFLSILFNRVREYASGIINRFCFRSRISVDGNANNSAGNLFRKKCATSTETGFAKLSRISRLNIFSVLIIIHTACCASFFFVVMR